MAREIPRPVLVVLGALVMAGAVYLAREIALGPGADAAPAQAAAAAADDSSGRRSERRPTWQDFVVPGADQEGVVRPVLEGDAPLNPFDRGYARSRLSELNLRLEGVGVGGDGGALALVSGRMIRKGDEIDIFRVVEVKPDAVSLEGPMGVRIDLAPRPPDPEPEPEKSRGDADLEDLMKELEKQPARRPRNQPTRPQPREEWPSEDLKR